MLKLQLAGQTFARLTVIREAPRRGVKTQWLCKCECGRETIVGTHQLTGKKTLSCGCLRSERSRDAHLKHGGSFSAEYRAWGGMIQRCTNPNNRRYESYGGRGIKVCDRWLHSFENFYADMGPKPSDGHSIDRYPDNDGNYEPGNCRWATDAEQSANKRNNRNLHVGGENKPLSVWAREAGMCHASLRYRLDNGMTDEDAVKSPRHCNGVISFDGLSMTRSEWAKHLGVAYSTITTRLRRLPVEEALDPAKLRLNKINYSH